MPFLAHGEIALTSTDALEESVPVTKAPGQNQRLFLLAERHYIDFPVTSSVGAQE